MDKSKRWESIKIKKYSNITSMWTKVPNTFNCEARGPLRAKLDLRIGYQNVVKSKRFRFACDFSMDFTDGKNTKTRKNLKNYGCFDRTPTKKELMLGKNIYELVPGNTICRPYFDIDVKCDIPLPLPSIQKLAELYIGEVCYHFRQKLNIDCNNFSVAYSVDQEKKRSCHIVGLDFHWKNTDVCQKQFMEYVIGNLQNPFLQKLQDLGQGFDISVYYKNSLFRCIFCCKQGSKRILIPETDVLEDYFCIDYKNKKPVKEFSFRPSVEKKRKPSSARKGVKVDAVFQVPPGWQNLPPVNGEVDSLLFAIPADQHYPVAYRILQAYKEAGGKFTTFRKWITDFDSCQNCYPKKCSCGRYGENLERWDFCQWKKATTISRSREILRTYAFTCGRIKAKSGVKFVSPNIHILEEAFGISEDKAVKFIDINQRYVSDLHKTPYISDITILRSITSTGKSSLCKNIVEALAPEKRVLYVCSSKSLTYSIALSYKKCGLTLYCSTKKNLHGVPRLATTINSLWRILKDGQAPDYDVAIFDEQISITKDLFCECTKKFEKCCTALTQILRNRNTTVLFLDAHCNNMSIEMAKIGQRPITFINNKWLPQKKMLIYPYKSKKWWSDLGTKIKDGKHIAGPINSKRMIKDIERRFLTKSKGCDTFTDMNLPACVQDIIDQFVGLHEDRVVVVPNLCMTAEKMQNMKAAFSSQNIEETLSGKQVFLYSQTITVGVDYNPKPWSEFEEMYAYLNINISSPQRFMQAIARVRSMKMGAIPVIHVQFLQDLIGISKNIPYGLEQVRKFVANENIFVSSILERVQKKSNVCHKPPAEYTELFCRYLNGLHVGLKFPLDSLYYFGLMSGFEIEEIADEPIRKLQFDEKKEIKFYDIPLLTYERYTEMKKEVNTDRDKILIKKFEFISNYQSGLVDMNVDPHKKLFQEYMKNSTQFDRVQTLVNESFIEIMEDHFERQHFQLDNSQKNDIACCLMRYVEKKFLGGQKLPTYTGWTPEKVKSITKELKKPFWNRYLKTKKTELGNINQLTKYFYGCTLKCKPKWPYKKIIRNLPNEQYETEYKKLPIHMQTGLPKNYRDWREFVKKSKKEYKRVKYEVSGGIVQTLPFFVSW